ncbi:hypothetical protein ACFLQX_03195 [Bacteroidota bacterium]
MNKIVHFFTGLNRKKCFVSIPLIQLSIFHLVLVVACSCGNTGGKSTSAWVGTWSTAPQLVEPRNMPPELGKGRSPSPPSLAVKVCV